MSINKSPIASALLTGDSANISVSQLLHVLMYVCIELFIFIAESLLENYFATQSPVYCKHIPGSTPNILLLLTQKVESKNPCRSQISEAIRM